MSIFIGCRTSKKIRLLVVALIFFAVRYLKKDTLLSLIGYGVSSVGACALEIATIIIRYNLDESYKINVACLCILVINFLFAVFSMGEWTSRHIEMDIAVKTIDTDDEDAESK